MSDDLQSMYAVLAQVLAAHLPAGWTRGALEIAMDGAHLEVEARAFDDAGRPHRIDLPLGAIAMEITRLRELTGAAPGSADAWRHATFTLFADGRYDCAFFSPQREAIETA